MATGREQGFLRWQWDHYERVHTQRLTLVVHLLTVPLFLCGTLALLTAPFVGWPNAVAGDAMDDRKGTRLVIRARTEGDRITFEIEDDGPGVPESLRDRIFEPFVTTKDVGEGTGLGLAVCRGIVEGAGGTIALRPLERGACFVVDLPLA